MLSEHHEETGMKDQKRRKKRKQLGKASGDGEATQRWVICYFIFRILLFMFIYFMRKTIISWNIYLFL